MVSIDSSQSLIGGYSSNNSSNSERKGDLILSLNANNLVLDLSGEGLERLNLEGILLQRDGKSANIGRIEDITLPEVGMNSSKLMSREFGFGEGSGEESEGEEEGKEADKGIGRCREETQIMLWSSINNEEFMYQGEESEQVLESFERERERLKLSSERRKSGSGEERIVEVVSEAQNRGDSRKRPRGLSYIDLDLRFKGISSSHKGQLEMLMFDNEMIDASIDERSKGWDSYKWWQGETRKSDKTRFLAKFQALALRSASKSKRVSALGYVERGDIREEYGAIEKHRGEQDAGVEYNNVNLGFDPFGVGDGLVGSPSGHRLRGGRDTIESSVNYFGDGLNSSDGARLQSGRGSMIFSESRRGSSVGVRLSTMLEGGGSAMSYNSSPFQFEMNSLIGGGEIHRESTSSELQRVMRAGGRLSGSIESGGSYGKQYRTSSIATSVSDIFYLEEIKSSNWSRSGITTSSGTYNLKTYTVQKFIASRMKEIKEIRKINKENGYLLDENSGSNKENSRTRVNNAGGSKESAASRYIEREETSNDSVDFGENDAEMSIYLSELLPEKTVTRGTAAVFFYHLLVLATYNEIKLSQSTPGGNIKITKTCSFNEES